MEAEVTGCLIGLLFNLVFTAVFLIFRVALFIISLPIRLVIAGVTSPVRGLAVLVFLGLVAGGLLLTDNPVRDFVGRYIDLDSIQIDIDLEKALEDIQAGLEGLFPGVTTKLTYIITGDSVRGRGCAKLTCSVDRVFQRNETVIVEGIVQGDAVNGNTAWLKVKNGDSYVYVHSSLAALVEVAIDVTAVVTQTPTPTPTPTATPTSTPTLTPTPTPFQPISKIVPCSYFGIDIGWKIGLIWHVECGNIEVLADRSTEYSALNSDTILISYIRIRPRLRRNSSSPIIYLNGGPGGYIIADNTVSVFNKFTVAFVDNYDVIYFDQRGTGASGPLPLCQDNPPSQSEEPNDGFATRVWTESIRLDNCRTRILDTDRSPHVYNSVESAADIEDIRKLLDYDQINLYGVSYGSRLALTYMRYYPDHVRSAILDGVFGPEASLLDVPGQFDEVLEMFFDYCESTPTCHNEYPDIREDYNSALDELSSSPIVIPNFEKNGNRDYVLDRAQLIGVTFEAFYSRSIIEWWPLLIKSIVDRSGIDRIRDVLNNIVEEFTINEAMHYAVYCNEEYLFETDSRFDQVYASYPDFRDYFGVENAAALAGCGEWRSDHELPSAENDPVDSSVPTLIMSGEFDPVTPPSSGERVAQSLSHRFVVEFPWEGHGSLLVNDCTTKIAVDFINNPSQQPNITCISNMENNPFTFH